MLVKLRLVKPSPHPHLACQALGERDGDKQLQNEQRHPYKDRFGEHMEWVALVFLCGVCLRGTGSGEGRSCS